MSFHGFLRLLGIFIVGTVGFHSFRNGIYLFSWHPTLMTIGFLLLMTEAVLAFTSDSFLVKNLRHNERLAVHWALQVGASSLILTAFLCIYVNKAQNNSEHFTSAHGSLGSTTCMLVAGTISGGVAARYSAAFKNTIRPIYIKIVHSTFGAITYALAITTICLGLDSSWFRDQAGNEVVTVLIALTAIFGLLAIAKPSFSILRKVKSTFRSD